MHCSNCGAEIKEGVRFCTNCGKAQVLEEKINVQNIQHEQEKNIKQQKTIRKQEPMNELKNTIPKRKFINKKRWTICIVTTIILIVVFGGFISTEFIKAKEVNDNINLGNKYLQEGKYEEAMLAFEKTIKIDPKNIEARVELSKAYINLTKYDEAENILKEAILIKPEKSDAYISLSDLYIKQNKISEALIILNESYNKTKDNKVKELLDKLNSEEDIKQSDKASIIEFLKNESSLIEDIEKAGLTAEQLWEDNAYYDMKLMDVDKNSKNEAFISFKPTYKRGLTVVVKKLKDGYKIVYKEGHAAYTTTPSNKSDLEKYGVEVDKYGNVVIIYYVGGGTGLIMEDIVMLRWNDYELKEVWRDIYENCSAGPQYGKIDEGKYEIDTQNNNKLIYTLHHKEGSVNNKTGELYMITKETITTRECLFDENQFEFVEVSSKEQIIK